MELQTCEICGKPIKDDKIVRVGKYSSYHLYCARKRTKTVLRRIKMSNETNMFMRKDGRKSPILMPKHGEEEDTALKRLQGNGWNISKGSYHVVDGKSGKAYHVGSDSECKYCSVSKVQAKEEPKPDVKAEKPVKRKVGRPKKVKDE